MDSKFGKQFSALDYRETLPATVAGIQKYLGSGLIRGMGSAYAKRIVQHFQQDTLRVLEEQADYLVKVEGIGQKRVDIIKKAWQEQKEIKNVMLFLQSNGVSTEALNSSAISLKYGGTVYKLGDKVMQIMNNYDKNVFNGDNEGFCN